MADPVAMWQLKCGKTFEKLNVNYFHSIVCSIRNKQKGKSLENHESAIVLIQNWLILVNKFPVDSLRPAIFNINSSFCIRFVHTLSLIKRSHNYYCAGVFARFHLNTNEQQTD